MNQDGKTKAVILFSGGLDSTTLLAFCQQKGFECMLLNIYYGQRHDAEIVAARQLADRYNASYQYTSIALNQLVDSALTNTKHTMPNNQTTSSSSIPITYVPARNLLFLSLALGYAETQNAHRIFIGANAVDYSGYPDCRPDFFSSFQRTANLATKKGVEGTAIKIETPFLNWKKADIIQYGHTLNVPYHLTVSCYAADAQGHACGRCDACFLRKRGFEQSNLPDPTRYQKK